MGIICNKDNVLEIYYEKYMVPLNKMESEEL